MEFVFRTLEIASATGVKVTGTKITYRGLEHVPRKGGAVVAINHTSYIDFLPSALAVRRRRRRIRYMIKAEMKNVPFINFLITRSRTIPVDRTNGAQAYATAVSELRNGELVGVYPEATISRSFELKDFKTGAVRMAQDAGVPIIPLIIWGVHRLWTKDHPRQLGRNKFPVTVAFGPAFVPDADLDVAMTQLREAMAAVLESVQKDYHHPAGEYWVPARLGGSAPTLEEALKRDEAELAERARKRAEPT